MGGWDETDDLPPAFANSLTVTKYAASRAAAYAALQEEDLGLNMVAKDWYHVVPIVHGRIENCM